MNEINNPVKPIDEKVLLEYKVFIGNNLKSTPKTDWDKVVLPKVLRWNKDKNHLIRTSELLHLFDYLKDYITKEELNTEKKLDELKTSLKTNKTQGTWDIALYLIDKHNIKTIGNRDNTKEIYIYKNGVYVVDHGLVKREISEITENLSGSYYREEIIRNIKDKTYKERKDFNADTHLINFRNGVYNLMTKEFLFHSPKYLFLYQIPVDFSKDIDCPKFKEFLNQILDDDSVKVIQEWFGYCLYRSYPFKKAIILLGERDTGKTTLLNVLIKFLGEENISGVSLQRLSSDKFALSNLYQKHANIYDDLSFKDITDNGIFKMLTGGGGVTGEKKFGDLFTFKNHAKITFSCNKIPAIKDTDDDAYFSRWILIRFEQRTDKPDKFLLEKITTDLELSGILNFALEGLHNLLQSQNFSYSQSADEIKKEMSMSASSLATFAYSELEVISDTSVYITKDKMEHEFINFASKNDLPVGMTKVTIGKQLPKFISIGSAKRSIKNIETGKIEQVNCWIGVRFKDQKLNTSSIQQDVDNNLLNFDLSPG